MRTVCKWLPGRLETFLFLFLRETVQHNRSALTASPSKLVGQIGHRPSPSTFLQLFPLALLLPVLHMHHTVLCSGKGCSLAAATWWLLLPQHAAEGFSFLSSFPPAPWLLLWVSCTCSQGRVCAARGSQRCWNLMFFPAPLLLCVCWLLCNQKLLKPDVLIYNPYSGKQPGLPFLYLYTFTSSLLPKEGLGIESQTSGRGLLFLPA